MSICLPLNRLHVDIQCCRMFLFVLLNERVKHLSGFRSGGFGHVPDHLEIGILYSELGQEVSHAAEMEHMIRIDSLTYVFSDDIVVVAVFNQYRH